MNTIFDYRPTLEELEAIGLNSLSTACALAYTGEITENIYIKKVPKEKALFDIALLLEMRNIDASKLWTQIPDLHDEYVRGFDCEEIGT